MHIIGIRCFMNFLEQSHSTSLTVIDGGSGSGIVSLAFAIAMEQARKNGTVYGIEHESKDTVIQCAIDKIKSFTTAPIKKNDNTYTIEVNKDLKLVFLPKDNIDAWPEADFIHLGFKVDDEGWEKLKAKLKRGGRLVGPHICGCPLTAPGCSPGKTWWCEHNKTSPTGDTCTLPVRYQGNLNSSGSQ